MLDQKTSDLLSSATSLQELAVGGALSSLQEFQKTCQSGQDLVRVNLSVTQEQNEGLLTKDTSGQLGSVSLKSADLQQLLANKLRANLHLSGSILYQTTWKERVTPLQRRICALRGSVRRISDKDFIGWHTCTARDWKGVSEATYKRHSLDVLAAALLVRVWPTPQTFDANNTNSPEQ
jgi:hypothetical protein